MLKPKQVSAIKRRNLRKRWPALSMLVVTKYRYPEKPHSQLAADLAWLERDYCRARS